MTTIRRLAALAALLLGALAALPGWAQGTAKKPNILVIWGDDIGQFNVGAYNLSLIHISEPTRPY